MLEDLKTSNLIFYCKEWSETVRFYRDRLRLTVTFSTDWFVEFRLSTKARLSIADESRSSIKGCGGRGITLAIQIADIEGMRRQTEAVGLKPTAIKKHPWGAKVFYLFDPEGHRIELWESNNS